MPTAPTSLQSYEGRCHCRAIGFVYRTALAQRILADPRLPMYVLPAACRSHDL